MFNCVKKLEKVILNNNANLEQIFDFNKNFKISGNDFEKQKKYKLVITKKISYGNFSKVYSAEFNSKKCAVKVINLPDELDNQLDTKSNFLSKNEKQKILKLNLIKTELIAIKNLKHPNIIEFYFYLINFNKLYFVMELAEKGDLVCVLKKNHGPIKENICRLWIKQLVEALIYIHDKGFAHRDIKADNILITKNDIAKLCDFGFSKKLIENNIEENFNKFLLNTTQCGTPQYSAPEILLGKEYDAQKSDIWSLGVVLFIMLNNSIPFYLKDKKGKNIYGKQKENSLWHLFNQQQTKKFKFINQNITLQARNLVSDMLEPNVLKRITLKQILTSNWLLNLDDDKSKNFQKSFDNLKINIECNRSIKQDILKDNCEITEVHLKPDYMKKFFEKDNLEKKIENDNLNINVINNNVQNKNMKDRIKKKNLDENSNTDKHENYINNSVLDENLKNQKSQNSFQKIIDSDEFEESFEDDYSIESIYDENEIF